MGPMAPVEDNINPKTENLPASKPPPSQTIKGYEGPPKAPAPKRIDTTNLFKNNSSDSDSEEEQKKAPIRPIGKLNTSFNPPKEAEKPKPVQA